MQKPDITLAEHYEIRGRFRRSVNLEMDSETESALDGYILTPLALSVLERMVEGIHDRHGQAAWSLTGPYGSGKSSFGVFLVALLCPRSVRAHARARELLRVASPPLHDRLFGPEGLVSVGGLLPLLITGDRSRLDVAVLRGLSALIRGSSVRKRSELAARVEAAMASAQAGEALEAQAVVGLVRETAERIAANGQAIGILLLVDELGKFLEHAASATSDNDPYLLQALAEVANRSEDAPILFVTTLHQSFERYAARLGHARKNEWAKVQGRFEDIAYQERLQQLLKLTADAIVPRTELSPRADERAVRDCARLAARSMGMEVPALRQLLVSAAPLHPVTALLLGPVFRLISAQNERSLFAFLSSAEPHGFQHFLRSTRSRRGPPPAYGLPELYDYLFGNLGAALSVGPSARRWALAEEALARLGPEAPEAQVRLVKSLAIFGLLGANSPLQPTEEALAIAVGRAPAEVNEQIGSLAERSIVVHRRHRGTYSLWEGSDLDLEALIDAARAKLLPTTRLAPDLERLHPPRPLVAKRHLFETGTLRYFDVRYVGAEDVLNRTGPVVPDEHPDADGLLLYVIPNDESEAEALRTSVERPQLWFTSLSAFDRPVALLVPDELAQLRELLVELAALENVRRETPNLESDPIAKRELAGRVVEARSLLDGQLRAIFHGSSSELPRSVVYHRHKGRITPTRLSARGLSDLASQLCDEAYPLAPVVRNELVNRRSLSSAAAAARRELIEAMLTRADVEGLGIEGCPPERSMYRAVLEAHGVHRRVDGQLRIAAPKDLRRGLGPVWARIGDVLSRQDGRRVGVDALYRELSLPPFGLKEGLIPILLAGVLIDLDSEVALYEEGSFVPRLSPAVFERLIKAPQNFAVQRSRIDGARALVFERLAEAFLGSRERGRNVMVAVVKRLAQTIADLPSYARSTRRLSPAALLVREALLSAKEPADLLFRALPVACGCPPFELSSERSDDIVDRFLLTLRQALDDLEGAMGRLEEELTTQIARALGLPPELDRLRQALRDRAGRLLPHAPDVKLKSFLVRAADDGLDDDRQWLHSLATNLASKPPANWSDPDADGFLARLQMVGQAFRTTEALAFAVHGADAGEAVRLAVARTGTAEQAIVVRVEPAEAQRLAVAESRIRELLRRSGLDGRPDLELAVLGRLASQLLESMDAARPSRPSEPTHD